MKHRPAYPTLCRHHHPIIVPPTPIPPQLKTAETFLREFFAARGLSGANGQPLYRYRIRQEEFDELREVLFWELDERGFGERRIGPKGAMALCLWASEWWHRNYESGPWKWQSLLAALGRPEFAPGGGRYSELKDLVIRGIRKWRRTVYRVGPSRGFLVTLACEGGLPQNLLLREETHLRAYLRGVLEEYKLLGATGIPPRDLAERLRDRLPRGWRQDVVYELSGELIQEVWRLQTELGETDTPVKDLDRIRPGWREELPIRVSDQVARTLLSDLLIEAVRVARSAPINVRWNMDLAPVADGDWEVRGSIDLPATMSEESFIRLFSFGSRHQAPPRFQLGFQTARKTFRALALGTERRADDGRNFRLEKFPSAQTVQTTDLTGPRKLLARTYEGDSATNLFPGASGLGEVAWVFVPRAESGDSERSTCRLAGQGSTHVREPWALVAVDSGTYPDVGDDGATRVGSVRNEGQRCRVSRVWKGDFRRGRRIKDCCRNEDDRRYRQYRVSPGGAREEIWGWIHIRLCGSPRHADATQRRVSRRGI